MGVDSFLDKLGPPLATGIVLALLGGAATITMAWRDLASSSAVRFGNVTADIERLRADLDSFRAPGGRFTKHDGDRLQEQINRLDDRVRLQETRPPRLNDGLADMSKRVEELQRTVDRLEERLKHLAQEQERICQRLAACRENQR